MDWLFVTSTSTPNAATFTGLANYPEDYELTNCVPLEASFPANVELRMDPDFPSDIELVESLYSSNNPLIVSADVTALLSAANVTNIELLPVNVIDHEGKRVSTDYFIVNILTCVDCIDREQSVFEYNSIDPESICFIEKLVVNAARLPTDVQLFRPRHLQSTMMIHRSLASKLVASGARGFLFQEANEFTYP